MSIEITFANNETLIKRYDRDGKERVYKNLTVPSSIRLGEFIKEYHYDENGVLGSFHTYKCMIDPIARKHYYMLNAKYQHGTMVGRIWEINEDIYWDMLGVLPPLSQFTNGFIMSEFMIGNITTKYTQVGDYFYCEFVEV